MKCVIKSICLHWYICHFKILYIYLLISWRKFFRILSFAQWRYSNQWSNREVLLLLVENYTQYPALSTWNIVVWGNFCSLLLREQLKAMSVLGWPSFDFFPLSFGDENATQAGLLLIQCYLLAPFRPVYQAN